MASCGTVFDPCLDFDRTVYAAPGTYVLAR